jgi:hypothetical protein
LGSGAYEASKDWGEHNLRGAVLDNEKGTYKIFQEMLATGEGGGGGRRRDRKKILQSHHIPQYICPNFELQRTINVFDHIFKKNIDQKLNLFVSWTFIY